MAVGINFVAIGLSFVTKQVNVACHANNGLRGQLLSLLPCYFSNGFGVNIGS